MRSDRYVDPVVLMYRNFQMNIDLAVGLSFLEGETRRLILGFPPSSKVSRKTLGTITGDSYSRSVLTHVSRKRSGKACRMTPNNRSPLVGLRCLMRMSDFSCG